MPVSHEIKQQKIANKASQKYFKYFAEHCHQQTDLIVANNPLGGRLCILGAGNCFDVDLQRLAEVFSEVHLVDIDRNAIDGAKQRMPGALANRIHLHAPLDISGANTKLDDWRRFKITPETLLEFPTLATNELAAQLPGPFDCVVSSCLISQILLTYTNVMGDRHPLLQAGLITLLVTHLRLMVTLTKANGQALWITDVSSDEIAPLKQLIQLEGDGVALLQRLASTNRIFTYLDPGLIANLAQQDPEVSSAAALDGPLRAWLWHNGPQRTYLVYASKISRKLLQESTEPSRTF